jgi:septum formation protein
MQGASAMPSNIPVDPPVSPGVDGEIILASKSVARARILSDAGIPFAVVPSGVDEAAIKDRQGDADALELANILAGHKARETSNAHPHAFVIGADQVLECDGKLYDKAPDRAAARDRLRALRGRAHTLVNGLVVARGGIVLWHYEETVTLTMRSFSDAFLEAYLDAIGGAAMRSVGAYEIEGRGAQLFTRIEGDYFAVLGLPLLPLLDFLRARGLIQR